MKNLIQQYRDFKNQRLKKKFQGTGVVCPICKSSYREFAPFGLSHRPNARCLTCDSLERHRLLWLYFNEKTNLFSEKKIRLLHFAPEKMFYNLFSNSPNVEYVPCDLFPEKYNYNGTIELHKVDITSIPFEANYFDVILCNHVLEHIPDDARAMQEMLRVLKPDGWCVLQVPIDYKLEKTYEDFTITSPLARKKAFGKTDHVRVYGRDYKDRLSKAGFRVNEDPFVQTFSQAEAFKNGLMVEEMVYYCTR